MGPSRPEDSCGGAGAVAVRTVPGAGVGGTPGVARTSCTVPTRTRSGTVRARVDMAALAPSELSPPSSAAGSVPSPTGPGATADWTGRGAGTRASLRALVEASNTLS